MGIDINTKFITLIGTPLAQSFAARMQNAAYDAMGLNMRYFYTEAGSDHLREIMDAIRYMPAFAGCAVTAPNKVAVLDYLDETDPLCRGMGACNTVVKLPDGRLKGFNTDGIGFYTAVTRDAGLIPAEHTFFCIGAGGAGRAICCALALHGAEKIYITDILNSRSQSLTDDVNRSFAPVAEYVPYGDFDPVRRCGVVINASGVGMGDTVGSSPMPEEHICPGQFYFDACYNPEKTRFLQNAEKLGCSAMNGLGMSLYQGAAQIELWTGRTPPADVMRRELMSILSQEAAR